jgi:hypothetical protein
VESDNGHGAVGMFARDVIVWRASYELAGDVLTLAKSEGKPDDEAVEVLGPHPLRR